MLNCQNATMALFAERLQNIPAINAPVDDTTGIQGGWDFSFRLIRSRRCRCWGQGAARQGAGQGTAGRVRSGRRLHGFRIDRKKLGLKLEAKKKIVPVIVIDKLNQKPTDTKDGPAGPLD